MLSFKRGLKYFAATISYGLILLQGTVIEEYYRELSIRTYVITYGAMALTAVPICFGAFLAVPHLIREARKLGTWTLDWVTLVFIGLPTFLVSIIPLVYFSPVSNILPLGIFFTGYARPYQFIFAGGTAFGYFLFKSFNKIEALDQKNDALGETW